MSRDPLLAVYIEPPGPYYRRRVLMVLPLLIWVGVAVPTLLIYGPMSDDRHPPLAFLLGLVCTGLVLVLAFLPLLFGATRELRDGLLALQEGKRAIPLIQSGDGAGGEAILRSLAMRPHMPPSSLPGLIHNVGIARLIQGDVQGARALLEHAAESGWLQTLVYRRHRVGFAQGRAVAAVAAGDVQAAQAALDGVSGLEPPPRYAPWMGMARALVHARSGRHVEALREVEAIEGAELPGPSLRLLGVLRAWLRVELGEHVAVAVQGVVPLLPGEPAWGESWPELMDFVRSHDLSTPTPPVDPTGGEP